MTLNFPRACGHPVNSVKCMRACLFLNERFDGSAARFERADLRSVDELADERDAVGHEKNSGERSRLVRGRGVRRGGQGENGGARVRAARADR